MKHILLTGCSLKCFRKNVLFTSNPAITSKCFEATQPPFTVIWIKRIFWYSMFRQYEVLRIFCLFQMFLEPFA